MDKKTLASLGVVAVAVAAAAGVPIEDAEMNAIVDGIAVAAAAIAGVFATLRAIWLRSSGSDSK